MACSYIHRSVEVKSRPLTLRSETAKPLVENFLITEGAEISKVALQNLRRVYPELFAVLVGAMTKGKMPLASGHALVTYGLAARDGESVVIRSRMVRTGLERLLEGERDVEPSEAPVVPRARLQLEEGDWAEELAILNRRRNVLERKMRHFTRFALRIGAPKQTSWLERVLTALPNPRRAVLHSLSADVLMERLFWSELGVVIVKNWEFFEAMLGDKKRFEAAMNLLNDRPDAHAREVDMADIALQRRELAWLEERITS
jgi:hypothetical protein